MRLVVYLTRFGIAILTENRWSPRSDGLPNFGTPFFARTSTSPGCVPGGICRSDNPSIVFTYIYIYVTAIQFIIRVNVGIYYPNPWKPSYMHSQYYEEGYHLWT